MQTIEKRVYQFSPLNQPVAVAEPGETLRFASLDCFSNKITDETVLPSSLNFSLEITNPAAGPVYVNGAEPGDVLVVEILDIQLADTGTITTDGVTGPLFDHSVERTKKIPIRDGKVEFNQVRFPVSPMVGVIGVTPAAESVGCGYMGPHGGNMDNRLHGIGARLYFPVFVEGALLQMGDVHAAMGDGELCDTGIEIPAVTTVRIGLIKHFELNWPVTETKDRWYVNACAPDYPTALKKASLELQRLLMRATGWDETDTYMYMSVQCHVEINQACAPVKADLNLRFGAPKNEGIPPLISE